MNNLRGSNRLTWLTVLSWFISLPTTAQLARPLTVYAFLSTECPISQQYVRQLTKLQRQDGPLGIRFMAWFPLRTDSPRMIRRFQTEYALSLAGSPIPGDG